MVLAGSTSAGSLMWAARAAPGRASTTAIRSRRVRMERPSTDFLANFSEELQEPVRSERDVVLRVARAVYAGPAGTRSERGTNTPTRSLGCAAGAGGCSGATYVSY